MKYYYGIQDRPSTTKSYKIYYYISNAKSNKERMKEILNFSFSLLFISNLKETSMKGKMDGWMDGLIV